MKFVSDLYSKKLLKETTTKIETLLRNTENIEITCFEEKIKLSVKQIAQK